MRVDDRFSAIAHDPARRAIRVHRESLANALRHREASQVAPASREADAGQCRLVVNALRRQIGRLERTLAAVMIDRLMANPKEPSPATDLSEPPERIGCRPQGTSPPIEFGGHELSPIESGPPALVVLPLLTTNTGGLIDLLA